MRKWNFDKKELSTIISIFSGTLSVISLLIAGASLLIAYQTYTQQYETKFSVRCYFMDSQEYQYTFASLKAPLNCRIVNQSAKPLTISRLYGDLRYVDKGVSTNSSVGFDGDDIDQNSFPENIKLVSVAPNEVKDINFSATLPVGQSLKDCSENSSKKIFEIIDCSGQKISSDQDFYKKILQVDADNEVSFKIVVGTADGIEQEVTPEFIFSNVGGF